MELRLLDGICKWSRGLLRKSLSYGPTSRRIILGLRRGKPVTTKKKKEKGIVGMEGRKMDGSPIMGSKKSKSCLHSG